MFLSGPGYDSYSVPFELFEENRKKLANQLGEAIAASAASSAEHAPSVESASSKKRRRRYFVVLKGGISPIRYDTDHEPIFRQESYFWWLTGIKEPDCSIVLTIDIETETTTEQQTSTSDNGSTTDDYCSYAFTASKPFVVLLVPKLPPEYATIMGKIRTLEEWKNMYGVDNVLHTDEIDDYLERELLIAYNKTLEDNDTYDDDEEDCDDCDETKDRNGDIRRRISKRISSLLPGTSSSAINGDHPGKNHIDDNYTANDNVAAPPRILVLKGPNTDSGMMYDEIKTVGIGPDPCFCSKKVLRCIVSNHDENCEDNASEFNNNNWIDEDLLYPILATCRVTKSELELKLMEHVTQITSFAHAYVMRNVRADGSMFEYQCESLFKHYTYYNYGSRLTSYTSICGCGPNSAVLHYGHTGEPNSRRIDPNDHCLFDMGAEYQCYASDITCSYPANGIFDDKYKAVYESVLNAQRAVYKMMKPGVSWIECHIAAELEIIKGLYKIGIVQIPSDELSVEEDDAVNKKLEELVRDENHRLGAIFMPHGLGHLIGIDTHDVGGYLDDPKYDKYKTTIPIRTPSKINRPGLKSLRHARFLQPNMVVTVEPGCYFIDHLLDEALDPNNYVSKYLNQELIDSEYRGYGGVRLEDVVTIRRRSKKEEIKNDGSSDNDDNYYLHNFTLCPRTVNEVEHVMAGGKWPPTKDNAPELCRIKLTDANVSPLPSPPSK